MTDLPASSSRPQPRGGDWLATVGQTLPRMRRVLASLRPTFDLPSAAALDEAFVREFGIRAMVWDVDGTLTHRGAAGVAPVLHEAVVRIAELPGVRHAVLSNCDEARFAALGALFPAWSVLRAYRTPAGVAYRRLRGGEERWGGAGPVDPAAPGVTAVRKPSALLVEFALRELGCARRDALLVVGDQHLTDVAGANLAGVRSAKVPTLAPESFPLPVRLLQGLDRWLGRTAVRRG